MARYEYEVNVLNGFVYDDLTDVTSITVNYGRRQITDTFRAATAVITGRNPNGLPNIEVGQRMFIECPNVLVGSPITFPLQLFSGRVADFRINYGMVANEDTWEIRCEDILGAAGRKLITDSWTAGINTGQAALALSGGDTLIDVTTFIAGQGSFVSAQSFTNANLLDILNTLAQTEQGLLYGGGDYIFFISRGAAQNFQFKFSFTDGTVTVPAVSTNFDVVNFESFADSYFNKVVVEPDGLAAQSAGTGERVYSLSTYDQTTGQAANLASYVLSTLSVNTGAPASISCFGETQVNDKAIITAAGGDKGGVMAIGLRGVLRYAFILGSTVTATPEQTRITFYLSPYEANDFLVLDDATFGVLDTNKLGF